MIESSVPAELPHPSAERASRAVFDSLILAAVLAAAMIWDASSNALRAAPEPPRTGWFTPACAYHDLRALAVIEERGEIAGTPTEKLAEAGLQFLQARTLCLSGREDDGIALYQSAIDSVIGFEAPFVLNAGNAIERVRR